MQRVQPENKSEESPNKGLVVLGSKAWFESVYPRYISCFSRHPDPVNVVNGLFISLLVDHLRVDDQAQKRLMGLLAVVKQYDPEMKKMELITTKTIYRWKYFNKILEDLEAEQRHVDKVASDVLIPLFKSRPLGELNISRIVSSYIKPIFDFRNSNQSVCLFFSNAFRNQMQEKEKELEAKFSKCLG